MTHPKMKCIRVTAATQEKLALRATLAEMPMWQIADAVLSEYLTHLEEIDRLEQEGKHP